MCIILPSPATWRADDRRLTHSHLRKVEKSLASDSWTSPLGGVPEKNTMEESLPSPFLAKDQLVQKPSKWNQMPRHLQSNILAQLDTQPTGRLIETCKADHTETWRNRSRATPDILASQNAMLIVDASSSARSPGP
eukprot:s1850_g3.t1